MYVRNGFERQHRWATALRSTVRHPTRVRLGRMLVVGGVVGLLLTGIVSVGLVALPARGAAITVGDANSFALSAVDGLRFSPDIINDVPVGVNVTAIFTNADTSGSGHTFTVSSQLNHTIPSTTDLGTYFQQYPPLISLWENGTGLTTNGTIEFSGVGWFEFVCLEPGHFQSGMYGYIAFGEAVPANLSVSAPATGPGLAVFIIVGTIVTLTVIAVVLGFVIGRRRGSEFEMPPQRLGYAEPPDAGPGGSTPPPSSPPKG